MVCKTLAAVRHRPTLIDALENKGQAPPDSYIGSRDLLGYARYR